MAPRRIPMRDRLPAFPWDSLADASTRVANFPDGGIDLSVGTPIDDVAPVIQEALAATAARPGYPQTKGTPELRQALVDAMERRYGVTGLDPERSVLPVVGTKEAIALLPTLLGLGPEHLVVIPELAYPTYEVSAALAGAEILRSDSILKCGPRVPALMYINSPANPHGRVLGIEHLRKMVDFARSTGCIVVSDECYLGLAWEGERPLSILHPDVCGGDHTNLIAVHSLSKTSNMASYRAGWLAGDRDLIAELLDVRRNAGLMNPTQIQSAMVAGLNDDAQEAEQRERYRERREILSAALREAGFRIDHSEAGLYLWAQRDSESGEPMGCREMVEWFAERGILVAPGEFYGPAGSHHVRVGLTATTEQMRTAAERILADS